MNERAPSSQASQTAFFKEVFRKWQLDHAASHGAALAFYTMVSMAPLLVLVVAITGLALGRAAAQGELVARIQGLVGPDAARTLEGMIVRASSPASGIAATVMSLATMLIGASGVFGQLRLSLNQIWDAPPSPRSGITAAVRQRVALFGMIVGLGGLLLISLALSAALAAVHHILAEHLPVLSQVLSPLNSLLSLSVTVLLFAMIYKVLPDVVMHWRDVWAGAAATAILFTAGEYLIGVYLGRAGVTSVYGAAGSLVLVLLWVYYSAQILFIGAEFTEVYSRRYGSRRAEQSSPAPPE